jgi:hypothetical protein
MCFSLDVNAYRVYTMDMMSYAAKQYEFHRRAAEQWRIRAEAVQVAAWREVFQRQVAKHESKAAFWRTERNREERSCGFDEDYHGEDY